MKLIGAALAAVLATAATAAPHADYTLVKGISLGTPDRWGYVSYDSATNRVFVAHSDRLAVINAKTGTLIGDVGGITGGTHGSAVSHATGQGFTDDGRNGKVVAFDPKRLTVTREIPAEADADGIALDPVTGHLFVVDGDSQSVTVIDPKTDSAVATIAGGEKLEFAVADGRGSIYVAGEGNGDLLKIDARNNRIVNRWPTPGCTSPHGIAVDAKGRRVFMGCVNSVLVVVETASGRVVARLPIGRGSDAVAFDPVRKRVFSSNGADGTITVYQQLSPDKYVELTPVQTSVSGRTMSLDPKTGRLFVAAAETVPNPTPGGRPKVKPGTLKLLIFAPAT